VLCCCYFARFIASYRVQDLASVFPRINARTVEPFTFTSTKTQQISWQRLISYRSLSLYVRKFQSFGNSRKLEVLALNCLALLNEINAAPRMWFLQTRKAPREFSVSGADASGDNARISLRSHSALARQPQRAQDIARARYAPTDSSCDFTEAQVFTAGQQSDHGKGHWVAEQPTSRDRR
jgi:hypothetical protein